MGIITNLKRFRLGINNLVQFILNIKNWAIDIQVELNCRAPKFLVDPLEGLGIWQCGRSWNLEHDPDFQH
jgi:hypothetical protein